MKLYLSDTNVLACATTLWLIKEWTPHQRQLARKLWILMPNYVYIPDFVLTEWDILVRRVLPKRYHMDKNACKFALNAYSKFLRRIEEESRIYHCNDKDFQVGQSFYLENKGKFSLADCLLLAISSNNDLVLLSGDKALNAKAKQIKVKVRCIKVKCGTL
jgi:rRNA-processing protein FCF1